MLIGYGALGKPQAASRKPQAAHIVAEATALLNPLPAALRALIAQQLTLRSIDARGVP